MNASANSIIISGRIASDLRWNDQTCEFWFAYEGSRTKMNESLFDNIPVRVLPKASVFLANAIIGDRVILEGKLRTSTQTKLVFIECQNVELL